MRAQLIAIGSELLLGDHVDTNSAWISKRLAELGVDVYRHLTIGDNIDRMAQAFQAADREVDVVICTGGLGPTQDDLTREALAQACGQVLEVDPAALADIEAYFTDRGYDMPQANIRQAMRFDGAWHIGRVGTAPAIAANGPHGALIVCLPGVPAEMKQIFDDGVVPLLRAQGAGQVTTMSRIVRVGGIGEARVGEILADLNRRLDETATVTMAFLASAAEIKVRLTAQGEDRETVEGLITPVMEETITLLGSHVVGVDDESVEFGIARRLRAKGWQLAIAESITGGGVGARLVGVPGATDFFAGGVIVYQTDTKTLLAGLDPEGLREHGPASPQTAEALALAVQHRLGVDVGVSVVGVAGPTTQGDTPVGRVYIAVATPTGVRVHERNTPIYDRVGIQHFAVTYTLNTVYDDLNHG